MYYRLLGLAAVLATWVLTTADVWPPR